MENFCKTETCCLFVLSEESLCKSMGVQQVTLDWSQLISLSVNVVTFYCQSLSNEILFMKQNLIFRLVLGQFGILNLGHSSLWRCGYILVMFYYWAFHPRLPKTQLYATRTSKGHCFRVHEYLVYSKTILSSI